MGLVLVLLALMSVLAFAAWLGGHDSPPHPRGGGSGRRRRTRAGGHRRDRLVRERAR